MFYQLIARERGEREREREKEREREIERERERGREGERGREASADLSEVHIIQLSAHVNTQGNVLKGGVTDRLVQGVCM